MKTRFTIAAIILSVAALIFCQAAVAADPVQDARDALTKLVKAAKARNVAEVKKLITEDALSRLEEENQVDLFIDNYAQLTPEAIKAAKAEVNGWVILTIDQDIKTKDGSSSIKPTVWMHKEDGQWKFGKPYVLVSP